MECKQENNNKHSEIDSNLDNETYRKQREKANARKRRFLDKMTPEQKELKKAKDRAYYHRTKNKIDRSINNLSEKEKIQRREIWRNNSKIYRERKKAMQYIEMVETDSDSETLTSSPHEKRNDNTNEM